MKLRSHKVNNNEICRNIKDKLKIYEENKENMTIPERSVAIKKIFDVIILNAYWCRTYENFYRMIRLKFEEFCIYKEFIDLYSHREFKAYITFLNIPQTVEELKNNARSHHDIVIRRAIRSPPALEDQSPRVSRENESEEDQSPQLFMMTDSNSEDSEDLPPPMSLEENELLESEREGSADEELGEELPLWIVNRGTRRVYGIHPIERQQLEEFETEIEEYFERPINRLFSFEYRSPLENLNPIQNGGPQEDTGIVFPGGSFEENVNSHPVVDDNKAEDHEKKCIVCEDNKPCVINTRCGHYICCGSCSFNIFTSTNNNCPICREKWDSIIKVFE